MRHDTTTNDAVTTLRLNGRMTANDHEAVRMMIRDVLATGGAHVRIDLSELTFIDSPAIGMLFITHQELRRTNRTVEIAGAKGMVKRVLGMVGFDAFATVSTA